MYWCAHKTATLTSIQHTVYRGQKSRKFADILNGWSLLNLNRSWMLMIVNLKAVKCADMPIKTLTFDFQIEHRTFFHIIPSGSNVTV